MNKTYESITNCQSTLARVHSNETHLIVQLRCFFFPLIRKLCYHLENNSLDIVNL